jgi:hypothetical protein
MVAIGTTWQLEVISNCIRRIFSRCLTSLALLGHIIIADVNVNAHISVAIKAHGRVFKRVGELDSFKPFTIGFAFTLLVVNSNHFNINGGIYPFVCQSEFNGSTLLRFDLNHFLQGQCNLGTDWWLDEFRKALVITGGRGRAGTGRRAWRRRRRSAWRYTR